MVCKCMCVCVVCVLATTNQHLKCNIKANWQRDSARNLPRVFNALALYLPAAVVVVNVCVYVLCVCVCLCSSAGLTMGRFSHASLSNTHISADVWPSSMSMRTRLEPLPPFLPLSLKASVQHNY